MAHHDSTASPGWSTFTWIAIGVLALGMVATLAFRTLESIKQGGAKRKCTSNLKQIGLALVLYQQKNDESLPDRDGLPFLSALYEQGFLPDANDYLCPDSSEAAATTPWLDGRSCSYVGRRNTGSLRLTSKTIAKFGSRTALAADSTFDPHLDYRNVLFADGHVEEVDEDTYLRLYDPIMGR